MNLVMNYCVKKEMSQFEIEMCIRAVEEVVAETTHTHAISTTLPREILELDGMSGILTRCFYNNLCKRLKFEHRPTYYLEVGTWKGSSLLSALHGNPHIHATCIDNWSEFKGPKYEFLHNWIKYIPGANIGMIEADCFAVDLRSFPKLYDVYLYDGGHTFEDHLKAITHFWDALAEISIIMIDDWAWADVSNATWQGLHQVGARIMYHRSILPKNKDVTEPAGFWNGIGIFIIWKVQA